MKRIALFKTFLCLFSLMVAVTSLSRGATNTWLGGGANGNWTTSGNFTSAPATGQTLVFQGSSNLTNTNNTTAGTSYAGITFNSGSGAFVIGGNSIATSGTLTDSATATETIGVAIAASGTVTTNVVSGGNLVLSGALSGTGTLSVNGAGTLALSGGDTGYSGAISLNQGTLLLNLATNTTGVLGSGEALSVTSPSTAGVPVGTGLTVQGAASGSSSQTLASLSLAAKTDTALVINNNGGAGTTLTITTLSETAGATLNIDLTGGGGATNGTLNVGGTANALNTNSVIDWATITTTAGTGFATESTNNIALYTGATALTATPSSNVVTATGNYSVNSSLGAVSLSTSTNAAYTLSINGGSSGGSLALGSVGLNLGTVGGSILMTGANNYTLSGGRLNLLASSSNYVHVMGAGELILNASLNAAASGILYKDGTGTFVLKSATAAANNAANVVILNGAVELDNSLALVAGSGGIPTTGASGGFTAGDIVTVQSNNGLTFGSGITTAYVGQLQGTASENLQNLDGNGVTLVIGDNITETFAGSLTGSGNLDVENLAGATLQLSGTSTYTGTTKIGSGIVKLLAANDLPTTTTLNVLTNGELLMGTNGSQSLTGLTGTGTVTSSATNTLTITGTSEFDGQITDGGGVASGTLNVVKSTAGTFTLGALGGSNPTSSYVGTTSVTGGTFVNNTTISNSVVSVVGGTLAGTGTFSKAVTIGNGLGSTSSSIIAPGTNGTIGTLTVGTSGSPSSLTLNPDAAFAADINSTSKTSDLLLVNGTLTLGSVINGGPTLTLTDLGSGTLAGGVVFDLANYTTLAGAGFSNYADGSTIDIGSNVFLLTYGQSGDGGPANEIALTSQVTITTPTTAYFNGNSSTDLNTSGNFYSSPTGGAVSGPVGATTTVYLTANSSTSGTGTSTGSNILNPTLSTGSLTVNNLIFTGSGTPATAGVTLSGSNTLTLAASSGTGITVQTGAGNDTISTAVALGASQSWSSVDSTNTLTVSGQVSDGGSNYALTWAGNGTLALTHTSGNSYGGSTTISGGTLIAGNTSGSATGTGNVTVSGGAALAGSGIIATGTANVLSIQGSSTSNRANVYVGVNSATDKTTVGKTLALDASSTNTSTIADANLTFNLNSNSHSDNQLSVGATKINFASGAGSTLLTLNLSGTNVIANDTSFTLIAGTGSTTFTGGVTAGQFAGLSVVVNSQNQEQIVGSGNGSTGNLQIGLSGLAATYYGPSYLYIVSNGSGDAIDVEVVPEPSTWAMIVAGLFTLGFIIRRRNQRRD